MMLKNNRCSVALWLSETDSTNHHMESLLAGGFVFKNREAVVADFQTHGKGNANNTWESEAGKNLLVSVFYEPPALFAHQQFYLNMAVSLGVMECVAAYMPGNEVSIKWPNDIFCGNRKIAGMLIKHAVIGQKLMHSVMGIGLNVNQQKFAGNAPNPVSLIHCTNSELNREEVLSGLFRCIDNRLNELELGLLTNIKSDYLANLFAFKNYRNFLYENKLINAKITGVSEFGSLQLEVLNGEVLECDLKEIKFIL